MCLHMASNIGALNASPGQALLAVASQGDAVGLCLRVGHDVQALGKMVIEKVRKGRCCEVPLGGHQVWPSSFTVSK